MRFSPIAIIGQACVLPDALSPAALLANVFAGHSSLRSAPSAQWRVSRARVMATPGDAQDRTWSDVGGYVSGFEQVFDPRGFRIAPEQVLALDPLFQWTLHGVREALKPTGHEGVSARIGLVLGNLSFPAANMARYAECVWLDGQGTGRPLRTGPGARPLPQNRFMSGLPALLTARALGLAGGAFALDAACASSLYAIKLACDRLHDGSADIMVAGAVNRADDLFLHVGFTALSALSRTGQSRPFHRDADGLVPAEGAAFVTLKRLRDAEAAGDRVLGVIRGVGLSNDGRARGFLVPSEQGQARAMSDAYAQADLKPAEITLVECHATGTAVGDATELRSMGQLYAGLRDVPIGSLKSNLGHLVTVAGAAGLLKVLGAMAAGVRPPTLHAEAPLEALASTPFRLLREAEPWLGPRRAAISAFGFGGNNGHLLVEAWEGPARAPALQAVAIAAPSAIAIVSLGARVGEGNSAEDFARALFSTGATKSRRTSVEVAVEGLKFPPRDLEDTLPQQLLVLEAAREAAHGITLSRERTSVIIGMGCDPEIARYGARWRLADLAERDGPVDANWLIEARAQFQHTLGVAGVLGTMPNLCANRINSQLDLAGPSFSVSSEELSGIDALSLAARALRAGEIDAALVGAVDLSHEVVHETALRELGFARPAGDAAVVLTLKRLEDAQRAGDPILAILDDNATPGLIFGNTRVGLDLTPKLGSAHAASGLLHVAAAILALRHRAQPSLDGPAVPWTAPPGAAASFAAFDGAEARVCLRAGSIAPFLSEPVPELVVFSGQDRAQVLEHLAAGHVSNAGPSRLVIAACDDEELRARSEQARRFLTQGGPVPEGVAFCAAPQGGEMAFVFTGAAATYRGMGRELLLALPEVVDTLRPCIEAVPDRLAWLFGEGERETAPLDQLWASSFLSQLHARVTRDVLGLVPQAAIGYSSGESNSLFALGAWSDLEVMIRESYDGGLFTRELGGELSALKRVWQRAGIHDGSWASFSVAAAPDEVRTLLESEPLVHLLIVNTSHDCVIGGEAAACQRVIARIGSERVIALGYNLAVHCPEVNEVRDAWRGLHLRPTKPVPGVRFYTHATHEAYTPTSETAADAITGQAVQGIDFARIIERAYADGVRVFIEHGPRGLCTGWIRRILGDREHLSVALDMPGRSSVRQVIHVAMWLTAAGIPVDASALLARLRAGHPQAAPRGTLLSFPAHAPKPELAPRVIGIEHMRPAPTLPSVMEGTYGVRRQVLLPSPQGGEGLGGEVSKVAPPWQVDVLARMTAFHGQLASLHRETLARQGELHQQFLTLRQATSIEAMLTTVRGGELASLPLETSPPSSGVRSHSELLPGPKFSRAQLEVLASGKISSVFGPLFEAQDGYHRQVRMPEPPLLLADRVTGIDAVAGSMGSGTLWTETDVREDSWYLDAHGRMPAGIMIEAGQADLLLISWLGADLLNRGERVYRLLGCELTFHGSPAQPGETLVYDIHIDGHAAQGDVRLFFFHYDCHVAGKTRLSVRHGQAGFFTDEELASSGGVLWDAAADNRVLPEVVNASSPVTLGRAFSAEQVRAFASGRTADCFGPGFEGTRAHVRTPRIGSDNMLFLDHVTHFEPKGGPWKRGYLAAETAITADDWFFAGHFKNDPCMPGTLMFDGCLQAMAFYMAALGFTIDRDGHRFEPVPEEKYLMRCRGQVTPKSRLIRYEVFVSEVRSGPEPTLFADLLCTVDGVKAFHARHVGLQLVPDWPLAAWKEQSPPRIQATAEPVALALLGGLAGYREPKPVATVDGFAFDYASLLACAWGQPSRAFGPFYARFDGIRRVARLPGPPYHFMSRITQIDAVMGGMKAGGSVEVEYDIPDSVWYFDENGAPSMPFCVLMEAALQPCGWLASFVGSAVSSDTDLMFRNLDGTGTVHRELRPGSGPMRTRATILSISRSAGMIIESFSVECFQGNERVYEMNTVFGFFPKEAFDDQAGLPVSDQDRVRVAAPSNFSVDLSTRPARYCEGAPKLAGPMLLMLDRVTGYWPEGGKAGLGYVRAEKDVDPDEWFFKAHFFQDPVQPGSLGIEALCQLLQFFMLEKNLAAGLENPAFEPVMLDKPTTWKYRGQVVPRNKRITTELEILEVGEDARGPFAVAEAWLWVDGKRIYHAKNLGMRIVASESPQYPAEAEREAIEILDPAVDTWLADHRPTWTLPALPMMSMVDRLAGAAERHAGARAVALSNVQVRRWLPFAGGPVRLRTEITKYEGNLVEVTLSAFREAGDPALSRFEPVATGSVRVGPRSTPPPPFARLDDAVVAPDPYASGALFHGPAFQLLESLAIGSSGATATLRAERCTAPRGTLHQGILDALTHAIPHAALERWSTEISSGHVGYPYRLRELNLYGELPDSGELRVEARFAGFDGDPRFPMVKLQLIAGTAVLAELTLVEVLVPKGPIGAHAPAERRTFLRDRRFVPGVALSRREGPRTILDEATVRESDWLPGNVAAIYGVPAKLRGDLVAQVALRDHVAQQAHCHPALVIPGADGTSALARSHPLRCFPLDITRSTGSVSVQNRGPSTPDLSSVRDFWTRHFARDAWPVEDLYYSLITRFVHDVVLEDPAASEQVRGRSCLYVANHQVGIESLLFTVIASALSGITTLTLAKTEHRQSWLGKLIAHCFSYPGVLDPGLIAFFDREDPAALMGIVAALGAQLRSNTKNIMVHVEGTRALRAGAPVTQMSSVFIDMALAANVPIVPVRFMGGLPVVPVAQRLDFPVGFAAQDIWIGRPLYAAELKGLPLKEQKQRVLSAINQLGPALDQEAPRASDAPFAEAVRGWVERGVTAEHAVIYATLAAHPQAHPDVTKLLSAAHAGLPISGSLPTERWLAALLKQGLLPLASS